MINSSVKVSREIFDTLAPILYLSRIMCLQPLKWKKSDFSCTLSKSKTFIVWSCVTHAFIVLCAVFGLFQAYHVDVIYSIKLKNSAGKYVCFSDVTVVLSTFSIGVLSTSFKVHNCLNYFHHLSRFDNFVQKPPSSTRKCLLVTVTSVVIVLSIFTFDLAVWLQIGSQSENVALIFIYFFPYYIAYFSLFVIDLLYWQLVYSIKIRLVILNEKLKEIQNGRKMITLTMTTGKLVKFSDQIGDLMRAYKSLTEAAKSLNGCYGLVSLIILIGCLVHLLATPYTLRSLIISNGSRTFIVAQFIWMGIHILRLMLIVEPCHGCSVQLKETAAIICQLRLSNTEDEFVKSMDFFLTILSQCQIEFNACGLTTTDRSLIPAISGAVTTYLVILFQFN
ncbi:hypothetical protein Zmor_017037 [Zophobas morio]|uniref:Gustatory receptor n=1 Tax=Zophobas morio TaxID=2755281 RepID=A0AA38I8F0_9CUCU|nr:hypothetical protein Zmor_017037 [Zophobas morio]